jgi:multiple sugar transport system ATP-binding protein
MPEAVTQPAELERYLGRSLALGVRPEHIEDAAVGDGTPSEQRLRATVRSLEALGSEVIAHIELAGKPVLTEQVKEVAADLDDSVVRELEAEERESKLPLVARFDVASRSRVDQTIDVVVDTRRVHYFDLESGDAVGGHPVEAER